MFLWITWKIVQFNYNVLFILKLLRITISIISLIDTISFYLNYYIVVKSVFPTLIIRIIRIIEIIVIIDKSSHYIILQNKCIDFTKKILELL